jgi:hypothetical protein
MLNKDQMEALQLFFSFLDKAGLIAEETELGILIRIKDTDSTPEFTAQKEAA